MPRKEYVKLCQYAMENDQVLENIFFDLELIRSFGYKDWTRIHPIFSGMGMLLSDRNYVEIRKGNRRVRKINGNEINNMATLFPIYNTQKDEYRFLSAEPDVVHVILVQYITGLVRKFAIETTKLTLDDLKFYLNYLPLKAFIKEDWITTISFRGNLMEHWQEDVVVQGSRVFVHTDFANESVPLS